MAGKAKTGKVTPEGAPAPAETPAPENNSVLAAETGKPGSIEMAPAPAETPTAECNRSLVEALTTLTDVMQQMLKAISGFWRLHNDDNGELGAGAIALVRKAEDVTNFVREVMAAQSGPTATTQSNDGSTDLPMER